MEHESETIELNIRDYVSQECACKIEEEQNYRKRLKEAAH